jgi:hypothetical protein
VLTKLGPNWVESSDGYSVRRTRRMSLTYREGDKEMEIEVEPGDGLAVYSQTIRQWRPPHDQETVTEADRDRILSHVVEAFRFLGVDVVCG